MKNIFTIRGAKKLPSSQSWHLFLYLINIIQVFKNPTSFGLTYSPVTIYAKPPLIKSLTQPLKSLIQSPSDLSLIIFIISHWSPALR